MLSSVIILSGVIYGSACRLSSDVSELGIKRGKRFAYLYLSIGLIIEAVKITTA